MSVFTYSYLYLFVCATDLHCCSNTLPNAPASRSLPVGVLPHSQHVSEAIASNNFSLCVTLCLRLCQRTAIQTVLKFEKLTERYKRHRSHQFTVINPDLEVPHSHFAKIGVEQQALSVVPIVHLQKCEYHENVCFFL